MAIDTAAKRRSVAHVARMWSGAGVTPDATPDQFWRQCVARVYAGILSGAQAINDGVAPQMVGFLINLGYIR